MTETLDQVTPEQAVGQLYNQYADDVFRFALHSIGNYGDAKDIVQEVFLRAYQGWGNFRNESNAKTWLFKITRNYIRDTFRRKRVRAGEAFDNDIHESSESYSPDTMIDLRRALLELKLEYRQVIALRLIQDLSVEETARILGWTSSKVRTAQHRAVKKLRSILDDSAPLRTYREEENHETSRQRTR